MSKSFPEWWKHGQKVRTASDGILTLNIAEDAEYWLTNDARKEVSVFSADILGPASTPEACSMTTDITELAQQELAQLRAELSNQAIGSKDHLRKIALSLVDKLEKCRDREIRWLALSDEKSKIITDQEEALEKAQQVDEELCKLLPPGVEYMDPPDGGDVTPLEGVRRMVADYRQRIAELESRTVKLPEPFKLAKSSSGLRYYYANEVDAALTAAGIKVEAE